MARNTNTTALRANDQAGRQFQAAVAFAAAPAAQAGAPASVSQSASAASQPSAGPLVAAANPVLSIGDSGAAVGRWQRALNAFMRDALTCRPTLTVDNDFGTKTYNATVCFQNNRRISADGIVGSQTWGKMCDYLLYQTDWASQPYALDAYLESC
ncbi:peptidoglycan-binding protein [Streptomyces sp. NPDC057617]|uniref:peptidoglycan-binding domain-containing protein n=1 Tax=Streptomyces sp. NPDC057617 TaxID=3346184 RepID=UPI0036D060F1